MLPALPHADDSLHPLGRLRSGPTCHVVGDGRARVVHGDALRSLDFMPDDLADAFIIDPPYSSGGLHKGDRARPPSRKYQHSGTINRRDDFAGESRDQRSWVAWSTLWLAQCLRVSKPGAYLMAFSDWRQLPSLTDAIQAAGWLWRGVAVWDKGLGARAPHPGYLRHQAEYIVWGTNGRIRTKAKGGPFPGVFQHSVKQSDKHHMCGKPTPLMRDLARILPADSLVVDPFCGSGSTGVGAILEGHRFIGIDEGIANVETSRRRLAEILPPMFGG